jgi:hypothetical protein
MSFVEKEFKKFLKSIGLLRSIEIKENNITELFTIREKQNIDRRVCFAQFATLTYYINFFFVILSLANNMELFFYLSGVYYINIIIF